MSTCTIYYPGLLGPEVPLNELNSAEWPGYKQTTQRCKLFSKGKTQPLTKLSIEARMLECFGITCSSEDELPISHFRSSQHNKSVQSVWCLDPVHIQIDLDDAVLVANESLDLEEQEARDLIDSLNQHFEQDGLRIVYHHRHQWLLLGDIELRTHSLSDAMFRNIHNYQPTGRDKIKWRTIINEAQMLLHTCPVNETRTEQGGITANSLWIWGGGQFEGMTSSLDAVFSDDLLASDVAAAVNLAHEPLPLQLSPKHFENKDSLLIFTRQMNAVRQKDVFSWFEGLLDFDKDVLTPIFDMIQQGRLDQVILKSDTVSMTVTRKNLKAGFWRIWRKANAFEIDIKRLRNHYGY